MKNYSGITLIVLVLTVVVLLILVGVTITSFTGDKGVLNETKEAKNDIENIKNKTVDNMQGIDNDLSSTIGNALNP